MSRLNHFFLLFPPNQMSVMIELTDVKLMAKGAKAVTKGEMLKFIGAVMLCTRFEFRERASLWSMAAGKHRRSKCGCRENGANGASAKGG